MAVALWLLALQGVIGAFDTIYYHEWPGRKLYCWSLVQIAADSFGQEPRR